MNLNSREYWDKKYLTDTNSLNREITDKERLYYGQIVNFVNGNVLELGCGLGKLTIMIAERYEACRFDRNKVIGVDFSSIIVPQNNKYAKKIGLNNVQFLLMDVKKLEFKKMFNTVVACEVFEHIDNIAECMREVRKVLKPKGKLIATVPHKHAIESKEHIRIFSRESIYNEFRKYSKNGMVETFVIKINGQARNILFSFPVK